MKVDSKVVVEVFTEIRALLSGIEETFQYGEYVEETITSISINIQKVMQAFANERMTPPKQEVIKEHGFLKNYEVLTDKSQQLGGGFMTPSENGQMFQAQLYLYLKRELKIKEVPVNLTNAQLVMFIEQELIFGSRYSFGLTTDFDRYAYQVIDIVAEDILAHRRKFPQFEMDFKVKEEPKRNSLLDIL